MNQYIECTDEVLDALENGKPVVAIETGGTFAGIPYPENVETAKLVLFGGQNEKGAVSSMLLGLCLGLLVQTAEAAGITKYEKFITKLITSFWYRLFG